MALSNLFGWSKKNAEAPAAACGSACGAGDQPEQKPTACGSACGAGDTRKSFDLSLCGQGTPARAGRSIPIYRERPGMGAPEKRFPI